MADERDEDQFGENEGKAGQQPTGQQSQQDEAGKQQGQQGESGQQGQSSSGQAQPGGGSETMTGDRNSQGSGQGGSQGEGFVGSQGSGSDEYLQERGGQLVDDATSGTDFAEKGQGAPEAEEDETDGGSSL